MYLVNLKIEFMSVEGEKKTVESGRWWMMIKLDFTWFLLMSWGDIWEFWTEAWKTLTCTLKWSLLDFTWRIDWESKSRSRESSKKSVGLGQGDSTKKWCIDYWWIWFEKNRGAKSFSWSNWETGGLDCFTIYQKFQFLSMKSFFLW